jgi:vacuolar-type H+-ATPase subunit I/STV1
VKAVLDNLARIRTDVQSAVGKSDPPNPAERILRFPSGVSAAGASDVKGAIELVNQAIAEMKRIEKRAQETEQYAQAIAEKAVESLRIADERIQQLEAERNTFESYINQAIIMTREAASALTLERTRVGDAESKLRQLEARVGPIDAIDSSRSAGASLIKQTIAGILQKSATPLANCVLVEAELGSHILAR